MAGSSVPTAVLRALSVEERRKKILSAFRRAGTLERCARDLDIPYAALWRMMRDDPALKRAIDSARNAVT